MVTETQRRRAIAERIALAWAANPTVHLVLLAGSTARGTADEYSDIELDIFWDVPPSDDERRAAIECAGGVIQHLHAFEENEWAESFVVEGIKVDTSQFLVETMAGWLDDVVARADTALDKHILIAAVQHATLLAGDAALLAAWRTQAARYPDALARTLVAQHLAFKAAVQLDMLAARDDLVILYTGLSHEARNLMGVLLALNRQYQAHPAHKWMDWQTAQFHIAPPALANRLRQVFRAPQRAGARELIALIEETFALVEMYMPEVDIRDARAIFRQPGKVQPLGGEQQDVVKSYPLF